MQFSGENMTIPTRLGNMKRLKEKIKTQKGKLKDGEKEVEMILRKQYGTDATCNKHAIDRIMGWTI